MSVMQHNVGVIHTLIVGNVHVDIVVMFPVAKGVAEEYLVRFPGHDIQYYKRFKLLENAKVYAARMAMGGTI